MHVLSTWSLYFKTMYSFIYLVTIERTYSCCTEPSRMASRSWSHGHLFHLNPGITHVSNGTCVSPTIPRQRSTIFPISPHLHKISATKASISAQFMYYCVTKFDTSKKLISMISRWMSKLSQVPSSSSSHLQEAAQLVWRFPVSSNHLQIWTKCSQ